MERTRVFVRALCSACSALLCSASLSATQVTEHLDINGALRSRIDRDPDRGIHKISFDTFILGAKYSKDEWTAAASYRWYGSSYPFQYTHVGGVQFAEYAWVGYRFNNARELQVGLNRVPFGLQPLFSSTFYETLGNVVGLEDVSQVGATYAQKSGPWDLRLGYYARPAWPGRGTSRGSTYSIVITQADPYVDGGSRNVERNTVLARLARGLDQGTWKGETGISVFRSDLRNQNSGGTGQRHAFAVHFQGQRGPWSTKLQFARQVMSPRNPDNSQTVTVGGFDGTFNLATRGNLYIADFSYAVPGEFARSWISSVRPYISYSRFNKSARGFKSSQRLFVGTSFSVRSLYVAMEWMNGRNDPYIGGSSYTQSLAAGGIDRWKSQLYLNIGYYF